MKDAATRFTTEGLVLKEMEVGESDRLVTLFTREYGIIRAFASGAKKINNKKGSATSALTYASFSIIKRKDTYKIYEAQTIRTFFGIGSDIETLTLSQYFCELALKLIPDGTENPEFLRLILNSLHFLSEGKKNPILIKAITELKAASLLGYLPDLVACNSCGAFEENVMFFSIREGYLVCGNCNNDNNNKPINKTVLNAMRHIVFSEFKNIYSFEIPKTDAEYLSLITEEYICAQTDYRFSALEFFKVLDVKGK